MFAIFRRAALPAALLFATGTASAATATTSLPVTATVLTACVAVTTPVAFGNYDPTSSSDTTAQGTITVTCTSGTAYNVLLDEGANGASVTTRKLKNGTSNLLSYSLYRDSGLSQNWGETISTDTVADSISGLTLFKVHTVYGSIPAEQTAAGSLAGLLYTDTVGVTINY